MRMLALASFGGKDEVKTVQSDPKYTDALEATETVPQKIIEQDKTVQDKQFKDVLGLKVKNVPNQTVLTALAKAEEISLEDISELDVYRSLQQELLNAEKRLDAYRDADVLNPTLGSEYNSTVARARRAVTALKQLILPLKILVAANVSIPDEINDKMIEANSALEDVELLLPVDDEMQRLIDINTRKKEVANLKEIRPNFNESITEGNIQNWIGLTSKAIIDEFKDTAKNLGLVEYKRWWQSEKDGSFNREEDYFVALDFDENNWRIAASALWDVLVLKPLYEVEEGTELSEEEITQKNNASTQLTEALEQYKMPDQPTKVEQQSNDFKFKPTKTPNVNVELANFPREKLLTKNYFTWKENSCWIDTVLLSLFKLPNSPITQELSGVRSMKLYSMSAVYEDGTIRSIDTTCDATYARKFYDMLAEDINFIIDPKSTDGRECLLRTQFTRCLGTDVIVGLGKEADPTRVIQALSNSLFKENVIKFIVEISNTELSKFNIDSKIVVVQKNTPEKEMPKEKDGFTLSSVILSRPGHFTVTIRDPTTGKWWWYDSTQTGERIKELTGDELNVLQKPTSLTATYQIEGKQTTKNTPFAYVYQPTTYLEQLKIDFGAAHLQPTTRANIETVLAQINNATDIPALQSAIKTARTLKDYSTNNSLFKDYSLEQLNVTNFNATKSFLWNAVQFINYSTKASTPENVKLRDMHELRARRWMSALLAPDPLTQYSVGSEPHIDTKEYRTAAKAMVDATTDEKRDVAELKLRVVIAKQQQSVK